MQEHFRDRRPRLTESFSVRAEAAVHEERVIRCGRHGEHGAAQRQTGRGDVTGGEVERNRRQDIFGKKSRQLFI